MKVSEISNRNLADYLRIEYEGLPTADNTFLTMSLSAAKAFISSYTGLTSEEIDMHEDIPIVVYVLVQDMYDNRALYVDKSKMNKVVETILGMYSKNLL